MKYIEAKITFDHPDTPLAGDLVAGVFFDFDLQGVVVEDPGMEPVEEWAEDAVARPSAHAVIGYLPEDEKLDRRRAQLEDEIARMANHLSLVYRISYRQVDEQDWAESWKAFFWPQKIGAHIVVKPSWRDYDARPDDIVIEIDPGMAFGTGTHPTTSLCVQLIETGLKPGESFLDIGTGSGILMVAAGKPGRGGSAAWTATRWPCASPPRTLAATRSARTASTWSKGRSPPLSRAGSTSSPPTSSPRSSSSCSTTSRGCLNPAGFSFARGSSRRTRISSSAG